MKFLKEHAKLIAIVVIFVLAVIILFSIYNSIFLNNSSKYGDRLKGIDEVKVTSNLEKEIKEKEGILIILSNNKNKSLLKSQVIINMDFNQELINQYKIYEEAIIINAEENIRIDAIRFNGIVINDYEIEIGRKEFIWRDGIEKYRQRDLIEAELYVRDTYKNIRKKIQKNNIKIKELYGINGIVKI